MPNLKRLPKPVLERYEWQFHAACMGMDPQVFFSPRPSVAPHGRCANEGPRPFAEPAPSSTSVATTHSPFESTMECGAASPNTNASCFS
jgi:hypothetical protein